MDWLQGEAAAAAPAALMLVLLYLLRGRTPEALHAYAKYCPKGERPSSSGPCRA